MILVATDKDLKQCLHDNVMMWDPASRDEKIVTLKSFEEETGLRPTQWPDVQAIIGDSSDNIPGVRGVGPKTAEKLFHEYASLEAIRDGFASMKPALQKKFDGQLEAGHQPLRLPHARRHARAPGEPAGSRHPAPRIRAQLS